MVSDTFSSVARCLPYVCEFIIRLRCTTDVCVLRSNIPMTLEGGEVVNGVKMAEGTCNGTGEASDVNAFQFRITQAQLDAAHQAQKDSAQHSAQAVAERLRVMPNVKFLLINSERISGWCQGSDMWPIFRQNVDAMVSACGHSGHNLEAGNAAELEKRFKQVAEMMYDDAPDESDDEDEQREPEPEPEPEPAA